MRSERENNVVQLDSHRSTIAARQASVKRAAASVANQAINAPYAGISILYEPAGGVRTIIAGVCPDIAADAVRALDDLRNELAQFAARNGRRIALLATCAAALAVADVTLVPALAR